MWQEGSQQTLSQRVKSEMFWCHGTVTFEHCVQCLVESSLKVHFTLQCTDDRLYHSTTFKGKRPVHLTGIFQCLSIHKWQYDSTVEYFW